MDPHEFLAAVQQRADAADAATGDGSDYVGFDVIDSLTDVPRLVEALTAALDLLDERDEETEEVYGEGRLDESLVRTTELRAVITDALTPKEDVPHEHPGP